MKRLNPFGSITGLVFTILLFVGLGLSLWFDRGLAFSPGQVTAKSQDGVRLNGYLSHAEFEKQCGECHDPFRSDLATKCLDCHVNVSEQIQIGQGAHSQIAENIGCTDCHPEHQGRNFDPTLAAFRLFDHSKTSFSLNWHQENYDATPMQCAECHTGSGFSEVSNQTCQDCHMSKDNDFSQAHIRDFGKDCQGCHDGMDKMREFDHGQTGFALDGKHAQITCTECHGTESIKDAPKDCAGCHAEPSLHQGYFDLTCGTCHTSQGWSPAKLDGTPFSHLETAGFSLAKHRSDYSQQPITCIRCHPSNLQTFDQQACIECHTQHDEAYMTEHLQQFGAGCMTCHDGVDRLSNYNHDQFFPLIGKHASIQCSDCHVNNVYRGTPGECSQCHTEPEIHTGVFGLRCDYCHIEDAWSPASLLQHGFPLDHGLEDSGGQSQCETCHATSYVEYTCYGCHEHQPEEIVQNHQQEGIADQDLPVCAKCHPDGAVAEED